MMRQEVGAPFESMPYYLITSPSIAACGGDQSEPVGHVKIEVVVT